MNDQMTRWTVVVDKKLDRDVRRLLAENGGKKGDLSAFVRHAVEVALYRKECGEISERNRDLSEAELQELVETATAEVRQEFWKDRVWWSDAQDAQKI
jgi:Arc/MetJ-type ribon-helix-helix transcriptional regulator